MIEHCMEDRKQVRKLMPSTLEGAIVRISDIIAYLGKDRQDAARMKMVSEDAYHSTPIGSLNSEIVHNLMVNIVENSYSKNFIKMDEEHFSHLQKAKRDNYDLIYKNSTVEEDLQNSVKPMMFKVYEKLLSDLKNENTSSPIFTHHIEYINKSHYKREFPYEETEKNQIVVDYIASMTDDYFIDLYSYLFPKSNIKNLYKGYFD